MKTLQLPSRPLVGSTARSYLVLARFSRSSLHSAKHQWAAIEVAVAAAGVASVMEVAEEEEEALTVDVVVVEVEDAAVEVAMTAAETAAAMDAKETGDASCPPVATTTFHGEMNATDAGLRVLMTPADTMMMETDEAHPEIVVEDPAWAVPQEWTDAGVARPAWEAQVALEEALRWVIDRLVVAQAIGAVSAAVFEVVVVVAAQCEVITVIDDLVHINEKSVLSTPPFRSSQQTKSHIHTPPTHRQMLIWKTSFCQSYYLACLNHPISVV